MFYKLGKKFFEILVNFLQIIRLLLVFEAFFTIIYWILELAQLPIAETLAPLFLPIKDFVHLFYNRNIEVDSATMDFAFFVGALCMLLLTFILKFIVEQIEEFEKSYDLLYKKMKQKAEHLFNLNLERDYHLEESKNNSFLILIKVGAKNLARSEFFNKDAQVGHEEKQIEFMQKFYQLFISKTKYQSKMSENTMLISHTPFEEVDKALFFINSGLRELKKQYKQEKWEISTLMAIEAFASKEEIPAKLSNLKKLLKLEIKNETICLPSFNQRYSILAQKHYNIDSKGIYKINEKEETVFSVEKAST